MKCLKIVAIIAALSIAAIPATVKARAAEKPGFNRPQKTELKDSIKDTDQKELAELIDYLATNGHSITIGESLAPAFGLSGARPAKSQNVRNVFHGKNRDALNCAVIYQDASDAPGGRRPACVILMKKTVSGINNDSLYFRIGLDGRLERAVFSQMKNDQDGNVVRGSAKDTEKDINSPAVRKTYETEMKAVKAWLKEQQVAMAKKAPIEKVQTEAEKATTSLEKEAETTPAH